MGDTDAGWKVGHGPRSALAPLFSWPVNPANQFHLLYHYGLVLCVFLGCYGLRSHKKCPGTLGGGSVGYRALRLVVLAFCSDCPMYSSLMGFRVFC